jgi:hypothetical protein
MMSAGLIATVAGMGTAVRASCTVSGPYTMSVCLPAHQEPPPDPPGVNGSGGCESSYYFWCVPSDSTTCTTEGYGTAVFGYCNTYISEQSSNNCWQGSIQTDIVMQYHRSACAFENGACQCVWITGEYTDVTVVTCDCEAWY